MLDRIEEVEMSLEPYARVLRIIIMLVMAALFAVVLLQKEGLASRGGLILLIGVLLALGTSSRIHTTRRCLQRLREASRTSRFWWRLMGFVLVAVGSYLIFSDKSATFLEEIFSVVIVVYVWTYNVLLGSSEHPLYAGE